ncbi:uncharacterized protein C8R40DRAFT_1111569 [Lentinula edodes]|uniref:uncharacterized protein n=1 Tax=Lentinula edodes TaxID=5353 RepID=UPI001E8EE12D|nr:uncharacterized protein C8R40DRAFT_1111569 [Lentinula edodes]KAH7873754.1 hypothetical protein C8R40DRAFT_1111569 [Lentinula edodes]
MWGFTVFLFLLTLSQYCITSTFHLQDLYCWLVQLEAPNIFTLLTLAAREHC